MTDKPLTANPEDRLVPPEGHHLTRAIAAARIAAAAPDAASDVEAAAGATVAPEAGATEATGADQGAAAPGAPPGMHTRPIHPLRPKPRNRPLAWSGFLLGALALVFAIALAMLLWRFAGEEAGAPLPVAALSTGELIEMETLLDQLGFPPGPLDGAIDAASVTAIRDFQLTAGLPVDGEPSPALLEELRAALAELTGEVD